MVSGIFFFAGLRGGWTIFPAVPPVTVILSGGEQHHEVLNQPKELPEENVMACNCEHDLVLHLYRVPLKKVLP
jgi:hypothetical protein